MTLKTRILLALGAMTLILVAIAVASSLFLSRLGTASEHIMKDNFISIEEATSMIDALDMMDNAVSKRFFSPIADFPQLAIVFQNSDSIFAHDLVLAEHNITEPGEREILIRLREQYNSYKHLALATSLSHEDFIRLVAPAYDTLKASCLALLDVNKQGMYIRNDRAKIAAREATMYTLLLSAFAVLLALGILFRFPALVLDPLAELTAKIKSIAERKYSERIEPTSHDEIGALAVSFNQMAAKLDEYERSNIDALIAEKKQSEAIVKSMNDGVIVLGRDRTIVLVNTVGSELIGLPEGDLVGRDATTVATTNNLLNTLLQKLDTDPTGASAEDSYLRIFRNGKEEYFLTDVIRIERTEGDPSTALGYVIELKNVSGFKALDEAKSGFVTTVSHELRTPLSALNMSLRLLQDERIGSLNPEQARLLDAMKQEIRRLLRIVNELLELSRAELGASLMHMEAVTAESIVDAAVTPVILQADQKGIALEINLPDVLPLVRADSSKIAWVLINLLSNAIRFTPTGGTVTLSVVATNDSTLLFTVKDTGIGIEPQNLERIFDKFFQAQTNGADQHTGVGLGLAISKEIINAHGGKLWAESEIGKGSTFLFYLNI